MTVGDLDQRITLQQPVTTPDGIGGRSRAWQDVATIWARVEPVRSAEKRAGDAQIAATVYRVTIRKRTDVAGDWRLKWDTNGAALMNIRDLPDPGRRAHYQEIFAESEVVI